jgi:hypothetical protein
MMPKKTEMIGTLQGYRVRTAGRPNGLAMSRAGPYAFFWRGEGTLERLPREGRQLHRFVSRLRSAAFEMCPQNPSVWFDESSDDSSRREPQDLTAS